MTPEIQKSLLDNEISEEIKILLTARQKISDLKPVPGSSGVIECPKCGGGSTICVCR